MDFVDKKFLKFNYLFADIKIYSKMAPNNFLVPVAPSEGEQKDEVQDQQMRENDSHVLNVSLINPNLSKNK